MKLDWRAFRHLAKGSFWADLWRKINEEDCWGKAATLSYYFLLAFFPFLLFLAALIAVLPFEGDLLQDIFAEMDRFLPERTSSLVREIVLELTHTMNSDYEVLSLGIAFVLWAASQAFSAIAGVLNQSYGVKETRSYFRVRTVGIVVTIVASLFVIFSEGIVFFGGSLIRLALVQLHLGTFYSILWQSLRWILVFVLLNVAIQTIYSWLPAHRLRWKLISPGGVTAALGWIFGSMGFTFYVNHLADYQKLYGRLAALIALMAWFYLSSLFLLLGGEIDSGIYRLRKERERVNF